MVIGGCVDRRQNPNISFAEKLFGPPFYLFYVYKMHVNVFGILSIASLLNDAGLHLANPAFKYQLSKKCLMDHNLITK